MMVWFGRIRYGMVWYDFPKTYPPHPIQPHFRPANSWIAVACGPNAEVAREGNTATKRAAASSCIIHQLRRLRKQPNGEVKPRIVTSHSNDCGSVWLSRYAAPHLSTDLEVPRRKQRCATSMKIIPSKSMNVTATSRQSWHCY